MVDARLSMAERLKKNTELPQPASNPLAIYPAKTVIDENRLLAIVLRPGMKMD
ncbi:hypothetical protein [Rhizobium yanglingense]